MGTGASTPIAAAVKAASDAEIKDAFGKLSPEERDRMRSLMTQVDGPAAASGGGGPVDVSSITKKATDDLGLLPQPSEPKFKGALCQICVRDAPYGGADKSSNGHRYDSIPFANGMINAGMSCQLIHYLHEEHDKFFDVCKNFNFLIVRCNPGQIKADGGDQGKFDNAMREMRKLNIQVWPSPDVMEKMGAKDALCKVANLNIGLPDTLAYYTEEDFSAGFKKTMKFQPRVIKQNRGSAGEGIWIIKLKSGDYCKEYGAASCEDGDVLDMMEANDNHAEEHTVAEFVEFCLNGRTDKSGTWTSKGVGKYLEGGKEAGGQLVDQRFCPRIVEGELRYNCVVDALVGIIHKKPKEGGISAVGGTGSIYTYYEPEEPKFLTLTENFLKRDLEKVMPALDLANEPVPLWWTTDFIVASPVGTPVEEEKWIVGEFNCSCVGISKCLAAYCKDDTPKASYNDISAEDLKDAQKYGDLMGVKALGILSGDAEKIKAEKTKVGGGAAGAVPDDRKIMTIRAREIFDSRGNPTVEVDLCTCFALYRAAVPSGASTGVYEALELRDGDKGRLLGKGVLKAVSNVNDVLAPRLLGMDVTEQTKIDKLMVEEIDGSKNEWGWSKSKVGANAILAVSMAVCRAGAAASQVPLYQYIAKIAGKPTDRFVMPVPSFNVINGGSHAGNRLACQEFMILPVGATSFKEAMRIGAEVYHTLKGVIKKKYGQDACNVGDEGGFAPNVQDNNEALDVLMDAIKKAGHGSTVKIGTDVAASEFYNAEKKIYDLDFKQEGGGAPAMQYTATELTAYYKAWLDKYPFVSIEDPFDQDDWDAYKHLMGEMGSRVQIVGDDLLVTNPTRVQKALDVGACNALLLKVNQIGSITEAIEASNMSQAAGWGVMVSHRSGETEDSFIADLVVGLRTGQIKTGAPCRSERLAKYNQLLRIEEELGPLCSFAGEGFRKP